jgi:transcriptional regulator with XRE-family HTH domain
MRSNKPFDETLRQLLDLEGISGRELSRRTMKQSRWGSVPTISRLVKGDLAPSIKAMESIASALNVLPETFAEYRLWKARDKLDASRVGLKMALRNLAAATPPESESARDLQAEIEAQDADDETVLPGAPSEPQSEAPDRAAESR